MTIKDKIVDFMKGKESVKVKEIQANFPDIKPTIIWGTIAMGNGKVFEKVKRGEYKLKD